MLEQQAVPAQVGLFLQEQVTGHGVEVDHVLVRTLRDDGESISELVAGYGVSRATLYRALNHTIANATTG